MTGVMMPAAVRQAMQLLERLGNVDGMLRDAGRHSETTLKMHMTLMSSPTVWSVQVSHDFTVDTLNQLRTSIVDEMRVMGVDVAALSIEQPPADRTKEP